MENTIKDKPLLLLIRRAWGAFIVKITESSVVSISLVITIMGAVWGAAITHSMASQAFAKSSELESKFDRRRELNDEFKTKVISDMSSMQGDLKAIKQALKIHD